MILPANHIQMRVLERIRVFQAIAERAVEVRVAEQDDACQLQQRDLQEKSQQVQAKRDGVMVNHVVNDCADARPAQVAGHTHVRHKKQQRVPPPGVAQLRKQKDGQPK